MPNGWTNMAKNVKIGVVINEPTIAKIKIVPTKMKNTKIFLTKNL